MEHLVYGESLTTWDRYCGNGNRETEDCDGETHDEL